MATAKKVNVNAPKFQQILATSGQDLLDRRSELIFQATNNEMQDVITNLTRKKDRVEMEILNLTDLSVNTRNSLRPGNKDYNPAEWVARLCELKNEIRLIKEDLEIALEVEEEYFRPANRD